MSLTENAKTIREILPYVDWQKGLTQWVKESKALVLEDVAQNRVTLLIDAATPWNYVANQSYFTEDDFLPHGVTLADRVRTRLDTMVEQINWNVDQSVPHAKVNVTAPPGAVTGEAVTLAENRIKALYPQSALFNNAVSLSGRGELQCALHGNFTAAQLRDIASALEGQRLVQGQSWPE